MADSVTTVIARKKMAQARANIKALPVIEGFAFGDGGIDSDGNVKTPTSSQTALNSELLRKAYTSVTAIKDTTYRYRVVLDSDELSGKSISEIGLYDTEGDLLAIKNFSAKTKDADLEMAFTIDDIF